MNLNDGKLYELGSDEKLSNLAEQLKITGGTLSDLAEQLKIPVENLVKVDGKELTAKQEKEKQVSLKDHKSKAGKILTKNRKRRLKKQGIIK